MANAKNIYVVPHGPKMWDVKREGVKTPISSHYKKDSAVESGHKQAVQNKSELTICRKDGTIQNRNSFEPDYCPPKG